MRKYIRDSFRIFYESLVTVVDEAVDKFLGWLDRGIEPEWKQCDSCTCEPFTETEVRPLQAAVDVAIAPLVEERVAALTAERYDLRERLGQIDAKGGIADLFAERDAARAELAAANARIRELEAQSVEDHETWLQEVEERDAMLIERDATLDRVTALAAKWEADAASDRAYAADLAGDRRQPYYETAQLCDRHVTALRAALPPEKKS